MSTARPSQALTRRLLRQPAASRTIPSHATSSTPLAATCHHFHTSAPRPARRPRFSSVKADKLGLTTPQKLDSYARRKFPDYKPEDLKRLGEMYEYTPEQMAAVEAGEEAVSPRDMTIQGRVREDKARLSTLEDLSTLRPVLDPKPELQLEADDYEFLSEQDFIDKLFEKMAQKSTENMEEAAAAAFRSSIERTKAANGLEIDLTTKELEDMQTWPELREKFVLSAEEEEMKASKVKAQNEATAAEGRTLTTEETRQMLEDLIDDFSQKVAPKVEPEKTEIESELFTEDDRLNISTSGSAAALGKVPGVEGLYKHTADPDDEGLDDEGTYQQLKKVTGMSVRDILSIFTKVLVTRQVVNQTRLGKVRSASVMVIAGNGNGRLGLGIAKSADFGTASEAARMLAIRNMKPIRRYENRTIYGNIREKISGTIVELRARPPGFGLRVPSRLFEMCRAAGIHDISAVIPRSRNPMNTVKATYQALTNQPDPEEIAKGRGKKMVDVRKVYYGGAVY